MDGLLELGVVQSIFNKPCEQYSQHRPSRNRGYEQTHRRHFGHGEGNRASHIDSKLIENYHRQQEGER